MKNILVAYATMAGSTADVAKAVGEELTKAGMQVEVSPIEQVKDLASYDAIVLGAPMILGWHRAAQAFLRKYRSALQQVPVAIFSLAMSLTQTGETEIEGVPVFYDENLPKPPKITGKLNFRERYAQPGNYIKPILKAARPAKPVSVAMFGGRMEYGRLKWWAVLFAMFIVQAPAGDRRNWTAIKSWAGGLVPLLTRI
jgi:menaquinone-dependent protoporphyrinogen oxidase